MKADCGLEGYETKVSRPRQCATMKHACGRTPRPNRIALSASSLFVKKLQRRSTAGRHLELTIVPPRIRAGIAPARCEAQSPETSPTSSRPPQHGRCSPTAEDG